MSDLPVVCVFGASGLDLKSAPAPDFETRDLDCRFYPDDRNLMEVLAKDRPSSILSIGKQENFPNLYRAPFYVRKTWFHFDSVSELGAMGNAAFMCFINAALTERKDAPPLVSVFTPTYKSGKRIRRPLESLLSQTYADWEWILVDDSDDEGKTFSEMSALAEKDGRIRVYKESRRSGRIGTVKRTACGLARGKYLVELDHDDELTGDALARVVGAFEKRPEAGFAYTDCAECFEDGSPVAYPPGWGMGYGSYRDETVGGVTYKVVNSPNVNPKTVRHIVAMPNHVRAWRKSFYDSIGGHRDMMHVADDYELMVRTFLRTRMVRIPHLCYVQYRNEQGNASVGAGSRNREIQRLVRCVSMHYDDAIHARFVELGVDDYVYKQGETFFRMGNIPNPEVEQHVTLMAD